MKRLCLATAALLALAAVGVAVPASAHTCSTVGTVEDAEGCNAHSCPAESGPHSHTHDTPWWDWSQTDHSCASSCPSSCPGGGGATGRTVQVGNVDTSDFVDYRA